MEIINKEYLKKLITIVKHRLGYPLREISIKEEQYESLYKVALNQWELYDSRTDSRYSRIKVVWVDAYFSALCKETLGRIRGMYSGELKVANTELKMDYESLLSEAEKELNFLLNL